MSKAKKDISTYKAIEKEFGKVISKGSELLSIKRDLKTLGISPKSDLGLNGGILEGTCNLISGNPKVGKTTYTLHICKKAQQEGRPIIYVDGESRLKAYNLDGVDGLDLEKIQIVHTPEDSPPLAAEDFLKICESLMRMPENKGAVCVLDSTSSLIPRAELECDPSATIRASLPKLLTHWFKRNAQTILQNRIILIIILHYVTNTSGYGKLKIADCGMYAQYQADTRLDIKKVEPWVEGENKVGQIIHIDVDCSSLGASGREFSTYLRYGIGIDETKEIIELAESFSVIEKAGSWYSIPMLESMDEFKESPPKFQGQQKMYEFVSSRPDIFSLIHNEVRKTLA